MKREELYYSEALRRTEEQLKTRQHFDTMATAILAASSLVLSIMGFQTSSWSCWSVYPAIVAMIGFVGVASSTIFGLWLRDWYFQPPLPDIYKYMQEYEDESLVIWTAKWISDAHRQNIKFLRRKALSLRCAYVFISIEVLALGIFVFSIT